VLYNAIIANIWEMRQMYTKKEINNKLIENNCFIDEKTLESFLKRWKIEAIYEDEENCEYFDDLSIAKIKKGLALKAEGKSDIDIYMELNSEKKFLPEKVNPVVHIENNYEGAELKKITLDITNQTLTVLAETIAHKITSDISDHLKDSDLLKSANDLGGMKRDNEILAKQVEKLIEENKNQAQKINELKTENDKFKPLFGSVYMKID
jgi:hypothetical protein